ncbi:DUF1933 domain-containing protein [Candidatus Woesearchaeota archaeon]|nr:DUF1933 domain-containing protein [Candidatus Woesearchaeota archaeon]
MANKKKAQSWSIDITLGVIIFMAAFFVFYSLLNSNPNTKASSLEEQASVIIKQTTAEGGAIAIVHGNEVDIGRLNQLKDLSYDELKGMLRVEGDFCIFLEDEQGNLVLINNSYRGIGSPNINLSGAPCSQK